MSFPRYPKYKDSGVEWLGEVPEHWAVKRLKRICRVFPSNVDKKSIEGEAAVLLCNYTDVYYNDRIVADMEFMPATATDDQIAKFTLRAGDTIITKDSETADDIAVAAYVPHDLPGVVCGYHLSMVRPQGGIHGAFVKRLFDSAYAKSCFAVRANGLTRVGLSQYELDNVDMPVPPPIEQVAITTFLDRETAKIDALIAEQQRLIELLQEKRQAVISHAVTKGLNPDAPMKDSRVEWLGEVPEHWGVKMLKYLSPQITVGIVVEPSKHYVTEGVPALRSLNVTGDGIVMNNVVFISPEANELHRKSRLHAGDIVAVRSGQPGTCAIIPPELDGCNCVDLIIIRKPEECTSHFLRWYLSSDFAKVQFGSGAEGAIQQHFNVSTASQLLAAVPPLSEQDAIVAFVDDAAHTLDTLRDEAQRAIILLQERRSALVSAAVTGQIDVRGLAGSEAA